jgi:hypothetical protein
MINTELSYLDTLSLSKLGSVPFEKSWGTIVPTKVDIFKGFLVDFRLI